MKFKNILSLFDGISCGQLALLRAGIEYDNYYASEIEPNAIKITQANFPKTIQLGDVKNLDFSKFENVNLLMGGSPCQDLSKIKEKRKGLTGSKSGLFFRFADALKQTKPDYFLFENVASMPKKEKETITDILSVEPFLINSALLSAQHRQRLYWTNIKNLTPPKDLKISLKHIVESGEPYDSKAYCITASYGKKSFNADYHKRRASFIKELLPSGEYLIRKLTPVECERLQTLPDNYTAHVSNTQRYKAIGNGWTVDVIAHILKHIGG